MSKTNKQNVEIRVTLHMKDQYGGDGQTEPTREQVREALIDFANNNLSYTEIRTSVNPNKPESGIEFDELYERADRVLTKQELPESNDAWEVHNDLVSGVMLIDGKEYTSLPLDTFGNIDAILKQHKELSESEKLQSDLEPINHNIPQSHTTSKIFTSRQTLGRGSTEQGGNRDSQTKRKSYNTERDPFNED